MKKSVLSMLLLLCFLISFSVSAVDLESAKAFDLENLMLEPEMILSTPSFLEEITISSKGDTSVLLSGDSEAETCVITLLDYPLIEFTKDSKSNWIKMITEYRLFSNGIIISCKDKANGILIGGADLFCCIQNRDLMIKYNHI